MTGHKRTYFESMGYHENDYIKCEVCPSPAVDIHHIKARGMGGTSDPTKNSIFNLMALCRKCHDKYGDKDQYREPLKMQHMEKIMMRAVNILQIFKQVNYSKDKIEFMK